MKLNKENHCSNDKFGSGNYRGTAIKQKTGRIIRSYVDVAIPPKNISTPPKKLA